MEQPRRKPTQTVPLRLLTCGGRAHHHRAAFPSRRPSLLLPRLRPPQPVLMHSELARLRVGAVRVSGGVVGGDGARGKRGRCVEAPVATGRRGRGGRPGLCKRCITTSLAQWAAGSSGREFKVRRCMHLSVLADGVREGALAGRDRLPRRSRRDAASPSPLALEDWGPEARIHNKLPCVCNDAGARGRRAGGDEPAKTDKSPCFQRVCGRTRSASCALCVSESAC